jgi:microcin C transport system substrate-binding protein
LFWSKTMLIQRCLMLGALLTLSGFSVAGASETAATPASQVQVVHAVARQGTPKYPPGFTQFDYVSSNARKGGSLRLAELGTFDSINPFLSQGVPAEHIELVYETLLSSSADEPASGYGALAEKIEFPADRAWVIFHIHPKARFHDGAPITAQDAAFSYQLLLKQGSPLYASYFSDVAQVTALDEKRVRFEFKKTNSPELLLVAGVLPVLPAHFWQGKAFDKSAAQIPLGSGPYRVKQVEMGRRIVYERIKDYWAADLPVNKGLYNFDEVAIDYYRDRGVAVEALKAGKVDFWFEATAKSWATAYDIPAVQDGRLQKLSLPDQTPQGLQSFMVNLRRSPFDNLALRQALNLAFDYEWMNKNLFYGSYTRADSHFFNSELAAGGLPSADELALLEKHRAALPPSIFTEAYKNPQTDGSGNNRAALQQAQQLLKEAGFVLKDGTLLAPKTLKPVVIEYLEHDSSLQKVVNPWAQSLKRLGIQLTIRSVDTAQFISRVRAKDFDMVSLVKPQSLSPGIEQRLYWSSAQADSPNSLNYSGIKNPVVDALVEAIVAAPDRRQLVAASRALDRVLMHNHYVVPTWAVTQHRLAFWNKFGRPAQNPPQDLRFDLGIFTWWQERDAPAPAKAP